MIKNLLHYLFAKIKDFKDTHLGDVINIIYYSFFTLVNGKNKINLRFLEKEGKVFSVDFRIFAPFFKKLYQNKAVVKKLNKLEKAFKSL